MIGKIAMRSLMESDGVNGDLRKFEARMLHLMGVRDQSGNRYRDSGGAQVLRPPGKSGQRIAPGEVSLRALAESLLGDDFQERGALHHMGTAATLRTLMEDNGAGSISPSAFANINAFTGATAGLMEAAIIDGYQAPDFIGDTLAPPEETKQFEGRKSIGSARIGDQAEERLPGMPTKRVQFGERWITQPRTVENALSAELLFETIYLDLTGQVVEECNNVGLWLGYRKELRIIDAFIGVTNNYNYKGSSYNTYITGGYYDNSFSNELVDINTFQNALVKFRDMKDPETNTRILTQPKVMLVNMEKQLVARQVLGDLATGGQYRGPASTTVPMTLNQYDPAYKGEYTILTSPLVYERMVAANGLGLTATQAAKMWFLFQVGWLRYAQNWSIRPQSAAPNGVDQLDRGIALYIKADERGVPFVKEPRKVVRCTQ